MFCLMKKNLVLSVKLNTVIVLIGGPAYLPYTTTYLVEL